MCLLFRKLSRYKIIMWSIDVQIMRLKYYYYCGDGVSLTFLVVMWCLFIFCGVAVFRGPPCHPLTETREGWLYGPPVQMQNLPFLLLSQVIERMYNIIVRLIPFCFIALIILCHVIWCKVACTQGLREMLTGYRWSSWNPLSSLVNVTLFYSVQSFISQSSLFHCCAVSSFFIFYFLNQ